MPSAGRYHDRLVRGDCGLCGRRPHREGFIACAECAEAARLRNAARYRRYKRRGWCVDCGPRGQREGKHVACRRCHPLRLASSRRSHGRFPGARRIAWPPVCATCQKPLSQRRWRLRYCRRHESVDVRKAREAMRRLRAERRAA